MPSASRSCTLRPPEAAMRTPARRGAHAFQLFQRKGRARRPVGACRRCAPSPAAAAPGSRSRPRAAARERRQALHRGGRRARRRSRRRQDRRPRTSRARQAERERRIRAARTRAGGRRSRHAPSHRRKPRTRPRRGEPEKAVTGISNTLSPSNRGRRCRSHSGSRPEAQEPRTAGAQTNGHVYSAASPDSEGLRCSRCR